MWTNLKNIMLSETNQSQKHEFYQKSQRQKVEWWLPGAKEKGIWGATAFDGGRVPVLQYEEL
jgi:hypothetical protein